MILQTLLHSKLWQITALSVVALVMIWGCDSDDDNPPVTGELSGVVYFHGEWPDSGYVQLSLFDNWSTDPCSWCGEAPGGPPPHYTHREFFQDPDPDDLNDIDTLEYTLSDVSPGTYNAIAIGWQPPSGVQDIHCDEVVIGLYGAEPFTDDSIPDPVTFTEGEPDVVRNVHAYWDLWPVPGCDERGRIRGTIDVNEPWPEEGLLVILSAYPFTAWHTPMGPPTAYFPITDPSDVAFRFTPSYGSYYLSIWNYVQPPADTYYFGAYGVDVASGDTQPDMITIDADNPAVEGLEVPGQSPAPHWISGTATFNGTRPPEGLLVLLSTYPYAPPYHEAQGPPTAYFPLIGDESFYVFEGIPEGTYYVSLWQNSQPPPTPEFYGAYGFDAAGGDTDPDPVEVPFQTYWGRNNIDFSGQASGVISGTVDIDEPWPEEGLQVILTTYPYTAWNVAEGAVTAVRPLESSASTEFSFEPPLGTYYLSVWNNTTPPEYWHAAYGVDVRGNDFDPEPVVLTENNPAEENLVIEGETFAPHWIAGQLMFTGDRPDVTLEVQLTTYPYSPYHPPQGSPTWIYRIEDREQDSYVFARLQEQSYYVSVWSGVGGAYFHGAFGMDPDDPESDPFPVVISDMQWGRSDITITCRP